MAVAMRYGSNEYTRSGGASGGGSGGGITMSLLWTNPSPTSQFVAQTVSLDLSGYNAVIIEFVCQLSDPRLATSMVFITGSNSLIEACGGVSGSWGIRYVREVVPSSTGLVFGNGRSNTSSGANYAVPQRIFGIKGIT